MRIIGVTLQVVRDLVMRFSAQAADRLLERQAPGSPVDAVTDLTSQCSDSQVPTTRVICRDAPVGGMVLHAIIVREAVARSDGDRRAMSDQKHKFARAEDAQRACHPLRPA
jgi:hypothetical protein